MLGKVMSFKLTVVMMIILSANTAAYAGPKDGDFFGRTTGNPPAAAVKTPAAPAYHYGDSPAQKWFAGLDTQVASHRATPEEKLILSEDFGNPPQLERVVKWTNTAAGVAKKYRSLSRMIKATPLPPDMTAQGGKEAASYRQSLADWYGDSASVLEEYIKPRKPARTQEELDEQLASVHRRSENVKRSFTHLAEMDSSLRSHFSVPTARYDDKLMQYVTKKPQ